MESADTIVFQLGGEEHCLGSTGSLWYLAEILKILMGTPALKCTDIHKAFKKEQEDCSDNAQQRKGWRHKCCQNLRTALSWGFLSCVQRFKHT